MSIPTPARVVIQSRMTSSRLPGKALLPICGIPIVALCALRAHNTGREVLVATSTDPTDDAIVDTLHAYGLAALRGSLGDVLSRFVSAIEALPDDAVIVRLTADNVLPDGSFIDELIEAFVAKAGDYVVTRRPEDQLPHGLVAEAFRASGLRAAHASARSAYDREHVTPWIIRHMSTAGFRPSRADQFGDLSNFRCTIDTQADYDLMLRVFEGVDRPIEMPWDELVRRLVEVGSRDDGSAWRC